MQPEEKGRFMERQWKVLEKEVKDREAACSRSETTPIGRPSKVLLAGIKR